MSVKAIGVRMAKLQHKLKYTNVLAPSLKDLPDYCPSSKKSYFIFNIKLKIIDYLIIN